MLKSLILGSYFALIQFACIAQPDLSKLRDVMRLPVSSMQFNINIHPPCGILDDPITSLEPDVRIVALKRRLLGDNRDAATYLLVGAAYNDEEDTAKYEAEGKGAFAKAAAMFREQLAKSPGDGSIQSQLGSAYWGLTRFVEAERWLRKAVKSAPNDGRCWANLGAFVSADSLTKALGLPDEDTYWILDPASLQRMLAKLKQGPGLSEKAKSLQSAEKEAHRAFDIAVKLAPDDSDVFLRKYIFQLLDSICIRNIIRIARGESPDLSNFVTNELFADLRRAADLQPENVRLQANALLFEIVQHGSDFTGGDFTTVDARLAKLSAESRETFKTLLARILKLASSPDKQAAIIALNLAWVEVLMKQPDPASLKQAGDAVSRCSGIWDKMDDIDKQVNQANYDYTRGIYLALIGKADLARQALQEVLKDNPDDKNAQPALDALGN